MTRKELKEKYGNETVDIMVRVQLRLTELDMTGQYNADFEKACCNLIEDGYQVFDSAEEIEEALLKVCGARAAHNSKLN